MSALVVESGSFSYSVHYSARRRSVALQIKQGQLMVRAPLGYGIADVKTLVEQKQLWILKHLQQSATQLKPDWLALQQVPLLGTMLTLELRRAVKSSVELCNGRLVVTVSCRTQANGYNNRVQALLQQWYKTQAVNWFTERVCYWQNRMQLKAADLVIGGVLVPGAAAPKLITKDHIKRMKPGSAIVDVAIDQGGCVETSKPTTHAEPTYIVDDVVHYCVANMPGAVPQTSTRALTQATLPYAIAIANKGWEKACVENAAMLPFMGLLMSPPEM